MSSLSALRRQKLVAWHVVYVDPFAEANAEDSSAGAGSKDYVHVRTQQRNGRKSLTTVQGLKKEYSYNKILKDLKKEFCCNGTVVQDPELGQVGSSTKLVASIRFYYFSSLIIWMSSWSFVCCILQVIQLQGDQRKNVATFLVQVSSLTGACLWSCLVHIP